MKDANAGTAVAAGLEVKSLVVADAKPMAAEPAREASGRRPPPTDRVVLTLLLGVFLLQGFLFAVLTPPYQAPDEPANLGAIARLVTIGGLGHTTNGVPDAIGVSERANSESALRAWPTDYGGAAKGIPDSVSSRADGPPAIRPSLYNFVAVPFFAVGGRYGVLGGLYAVRALSILLGALAVAFTFLLARELRTGPRALPLLAAATVAFVPQFGFVTASVNKDSMAAAAGCLALWLIARAARRGITVLRLAGAGTAVVAGTLTKPTLLALVVPLTITAAVAVHRSATRRRLWATARVFLAVAALVSFAAILALKASSHGLDYVQALLHTAPASALHAVHWSTISDATVSSWGNFGWANVSLHPAAYLAVICLMVASTAGLIRLAGRGRGETPMDPASGAIVAGLVAAVVVVGIIILVGQADGFGTQGRFWFPVIGAFAVLLALGLCSIAPAIASRRGVMVSVLLAAGLNLTLLLRLFPDRFGFL